MPAELHSTEQILTETSRLVPLMKWCELREYKWNEYVTIAVNRNLSNCEKARKQRKGFRGFNGIRTRGLCVSAAVLYQPELWRPIHWRPANSLSSSTRERNESQNEMMWSAGIQMKWVCDHRSDGHILISGWEICVSAGTRYTYRTPWYCINRKREKKEREISGKLSYSTYRDRSPPPQALLGSYFLISPQACGEERKDEPKSACWGGYDVPSLIMQNGSLGVPSIRVTVSLSFASWPSIALTAKSHYVR